jgi:hypothetical protein
MVGMSNGRESIVIGEFYYHRAQKNKKQEPFLLDVESCVIPISNHQLLLPVGCEAPPNQQTNGNTYKYI